MIIFTLSVVAWCLSTFLFKIIMNKYNSTPQELLYYVSLLCSTGFYFYIKSKGMDVLDVEPNKRALLAGRVIYGCLDDIF